MDKIELEARDDGVRLLTLRDPQRRNALGAQMGAELLASARDLAADAAVRVLVITGEGSSFCAGADLPALFGDPERPLAETRAVLRDYYQAFFAVRQLPFPTIAAVNGPAVGAGLNLAMACDLRVAGHAAAFGATFARIGLHPGGGATWFLTRALGPGRALRTLLLGDTLDAERAVAWGLAEEGPVDDPVAAALDLARRIAGLDAGLAAQIKQAVGIAVGGDLDAVVDFETDAQAASAASPILQAWVDRFR